MNLNQAPLSLRLSPFSLDHQPDSADGHPPAYPRGRSSVIPLFFRVPVCVPDLVLSRVLASAL